MNKTLKTIAFSVIVGVPFALTHAQPGRQTIPNLAAYPDPAGNVRTYNQNGNIDLTGAFFQSLGTNGRSCSTCHQLSDAMSLSAAHAQQRFDASQGLEPLFRSNDGTVCDHDIDVSTLAGRSAAYSLLRTRGLIRVALDVPLVRDFDVVSVQNPYHCNETGTLSLYRRPLPAANLKFLSAVMFDGRESSTETGTTPIAPANYPSSLIADLKHQAMDATLGHAQGLPPGPTPQQQTEIANFELGLYTAQAEDRGAGTLGAQGAGGGPQYIDAQPFFIGINDPVGLDPTNPVPLNFNKHIFDLFDSWKGAGSPARQSIYRGQAIFNTRTFTVSGVGGLNGQTFSNGFTAPDSFTATCGICHDTPNVGNHSISAPLDIGVGDPPGGLNVLDTSYLPVITICQRPSLSTCVQTTDPGRAMITGLFADVGRFKGPVLRGLSARAPYFHNGSARSLMDVVEFYESRFSMGLSKQDKQDLVAFLSSL